MELGWTSKRSFWCFLSHYGFSFRGKSQKFYSFYLHFQLLYIPFMIAMLKPEIFQHSCYKIMFLLGLIDMITIPSDTIVPGLQEILGIHYCANPELFYTVGTIALRKYRRFYCNKNYSRIPCGHYYLLHSGVRSIFYSNFSWGEQEAFRWKNGLFLDSITNCLCTHFFNTRL